jgi:hypothetical protein
MRTRREMLYGNNVRISEKKIEEESQPYLVFEEKQSFKLICLNSRESVVPSTVSVGERVSFRSSHLLGLRKVRPQVL